MSLHEHERENRVIDLANTPRATASAPRWLSCQSLALVTQLNEQCLDVLVGDAAAGACNRPRLCFDPDLWIRLDAAARRRAARLPFVILDVHFADARWWRRQTDSQTLAVHEPPHSNGPPSALSERLGQEVLMFAWQMARSDRIAAQVSFAMHLSVAALIETLTPGQVRDLAGNCCGELNLRWAGDEHFWRELLQAAHDGDDETVRELHLHAKLLVLGPLIYTEPG